MRECDGGAKDGSEERGEGRKTGGENLFLILAEGWSKEINGLGQGPVQSSHPAFSFLAQLALVSSKFARSTILPLGLCILS